MVSIGTLSLGVEIKEATQSINELKNIKEEINITKEESEKAGNNFGNLNQNMNESRSSANNLTGTISRLTSWLNLGSVAIGGYIAKAVSLTGIFSSIVAIGKGVLGVIGSIGAVLSGTVGIIIAIVGALALFLSELFMITDVTRLSATAVNEFVDDVWDGFTSIGRGAVDRVINGFGRIKTFISDLTSDIIDFENDIIDRFRNIGNRIRDFIPSFGDVNANISESTTKTTKTEAQVMSTDTNSTENNETNVSISNINVKFDEDIDLGNLNPNEKRRLVGEISDELKDDIERKL